MNRRFAAALFTVTVAVVAGSCSGDGPTGNPPAPIVASILVAPGADTIVTLGRTQQFTGSARDGNNVVIPDAPLRWRSSDTLIARVDSLNGLMTAVGPGTVTISAAVGAVAGNATVDIIQFVAGVTVTPATNDFVTVADTQQLTAVARDSSNAIVAGVRFLWTSSDPSVVTVDTLGLARSVSSGNATISATGRGTPGYASVNVNQAAAALAFITEPTTSTAGASMSPAVRVEIRDSFGARVTNASHAVTIALGVNFTGATLTGTRTANAINGVATFAGLSMDKVSTTYNLVATASGLSTDTSAFFDVTPGPLARITVSVATSHQVNVAPGGGTFINGYDAFGNLASLASVNGELVFMIDQSELSASLGTMTNPEFYQVHFTGPTFDRPVRGARLRFFVPGSGIEVFTQPLNATTTASAVTAGQAHACIATATNTFCWGQGQHGQLGGPTQPLNNGFPSPVINGAGLSGLTAASEFSCGLTAAGLARCWGGRFGTAGAISAYGAGGNIAFTALSADNDWLCGLTATGEVWCLGANASGLGDGATTNSTTFVQVANSGSPGHVYTRLDVASFHACALNAAGEAWCWGLGAEGQLGDSTQFSRATPVLVAGSGTGQRVFSRIAAGGQHTCALNQVGNAFCWGLSNAGQAGSPSSGLLVPTQIPAGAVGAGFFSDIVAGGGHTCAISSGEVWCWGANDSGQLGHGTFANTAIQTRVPGLPIVNAIAAGGQFTCARQVQQIFCWGSAGFNQTGQGSGGAVVQALPVRVIH